MSGPHIEDDPDLRPRYSGEVLDVAHPPGAHLEHKVCRRGSDPTDGQRNTNLGVEGTHVGHGLAMALQYRPQQVLGAGLS